MLGLEANVFQNVVCLQYLNRITSCHYSVGHLLLLSHFPLQTPLSIENWGEAEANTLFSLAWRQVASIARVLSP